MKICSFGEILFDIINDEPFLGGAPLNFAGNLTRLGAEVIMVSRVGDDDLAIRALQTIRDLGINAGYIQWDTRKPTGTVQVRMEDGEPHYTIMEDVAYDWIDSSLTAGLSEEDCNLLYFGTLAQRSPVTRTALNHILSNGHFDHIFYDINIRPGFIDNEIIGTSLKQCTILKLNESEFDYLTREFLTEGKPPVALCRQLQQEYEIELIVITAGGRGCHVYYNQELHFIPGNEVGIVDAVGAGDAFSAAFVHSFLRTGDPLRSAAAGNLLGAFVAGSRGAQPDIPENLLEEIKRIHR